MNVLFVVEKPFTGKLIKKVLEDNKDIFTDTYYFDYIKMVTHINDEFFKIRKRDDGYFCGRTKVNFIPLKLNAIDIPIDTYLENQETSFSYNKDIDHSIIDVVVSACDPDVCGKLAFAKYVEHYDIKNPIVLNINDLAEQSLKNSLQLHNAIPFEKDFEKVKDFLIKENFRSEYPRKNDVLALREQTKMTRKEFSKYFCIPYRTLENWEFDEAFCPIYLYDLMKYKLQNEKLI